MALIPAKCTQCGANIEVDDTHEAGICQHCGTPFITEKAINNYNIKNTIIIQSGGNIINVGDDLNKKYENYMELARRAISNSDVENQKKYFTLALEIDPKSWECVFNLGLIKSTEMHKVLDNSASTTQYVKTVDEVINIVKEEEISDAFSHISEVTLRYAHAMIVRATNAFNNASFSEQMNSSVNMGTESYNCRCRALLIYTIVGDLLEKRSRDSKIIEKCCVPLWKKRIEDSIKYKISYQNLSSEKQKEVNELKVYEDKIKKYDSQYAMPTVNTKGSGCYVATYVYGSYDCPEVWILRRFRDYTLDETWYGRLFIKCYYAISPTIVKWFGSTEWFKTFWKKRLDTMVTNLRAKGVEDTEYTDKY